MPEAAFIINVSNDAWFGNTSAPFQHLQIVRVRALESGRAVVRATNTGITAFINHKGHVIERAPQFLPATVKNKVVSRAGLTPYVRYGDLPALTIATAILLFFSAYLIRQLVYPRNKDKSC